MPRFDKTRYRSRSSSRSRGRSSDSRDIRSRSRRRKRDNSLRRSRYDSRRRHRSRSRIRRSRSRSYRVHSNLSIQPHNNSEVTSDSSLQSTLNAILRRLDAIKNSKSHTFAVSANTSKGVVERTDDYLLTQCNYSSPNDTSNNNPVQNKNTRSTEQESPAIAQSSASHRVCDDRECSATQNSSVDRGSGTTELIEFLKSLQSVRTGNYFISNFDPAINSIDAWCEEVDRARVANRWSDSECLSRVASCLKGDAQVWLSEWVTNDRTWTNFKQEFKPLCPQRLDYANLLYDVMNATSDKYSTYADYARRSLLRLRVIKGISDELCTLIVIRGIDNAQIRAANANLTADNLVSFLSIYVKAVKGKQETLVNNSSQHIRYPFRNTPKQSDIKCFSCGLRGHLERNCKRSNLITNRDKSSTQTHSLCSFCKKPGHLESDCFTKTRFDNNTRNQ